MSLDALEGKFRRLAELRQNRDIAKKGSDRAEKAYRAYEAELLEELSESKVKGSIKFEFGGELGDISFTPRKTTYGQVVDMEAALASLAAEDPQMAEAMTEQKFSARRLNELVRDRIESGEELPDGIGFYDKKGITISRKTS